MTVIIEDEALNNTAFIVLILGCIGFGIWFWGWFLGLFPYLIWD